MKNPKIKATTIAPGSSEVTSTASLKEGDTEGEKQKKIETASVRARSYTKLPDMIAESDIVVRNWKIPKGAEMFPTEWRMQFADLYYPYAKGGPLFVDTPALEHDAVRCERKLEVLKKHGIRYTFVRTGETFADAMARLDDEKAIATLKKRKADQATREEASA